MFADLFGEGRFLDPGMLPKPKQGWRPLVYLLVYL